MAFTDSEIALLTEIALDARSAIASRVDGLDSGTEGRIKDDLDTWETIRNSHVRMHGGKDGINVDNERKRTAIRMRVRNWLGYDDLIPEALLAASGDAMQLFELEVGSNYE